MVDYSKQTQGRATRAVGWIVVGTIALILGIYMLAQIAVSSHAKQAVRESPAMTAQAMAERTKPVGEVKVDPNAPATPALAAAPAADASAAPAATTAAGAATPAAASDATGDKGKTTYESVCVTCHKDGIAGAPKLGDKASWEARVAQGKDLLYEHALKGKGVMPAKGGRLDLPDGDIKAAVDYMTAQLK
jgi:cytochrome c5